MFLKIRLLPCAEHFSSTKIKNKQTNKKTQNIYITSSTHCFFTRFISLSSSALVVSGDLNLQVI